MRSPKMTVPPLPNGSTDDAFQPGGSDDSGERMVQRWLEAQAMEGLRKLLLKNIRTRLSVELNKLRRAAVTGQLEELHRLAHTIKGWTGTFKMDEIYEIILEIEERSSALDPSSLPEMRVAAHRLLEEVARIPGRYLAESGPEQSGHEPAFPVGFRILIADPNAASRAQTRSVFSKRGIETEEFINGAEALYEKLNDGPTFHVLLVDIDAPKLAVWHSIKEIRKDEALRHLHIVGLTTSETPNARLKRSIGAGCDDCMTKPLDLERFHRRLHGHLVI